MKTEHYQAITNKIIESIESGRASFEMPWINNTGLPMKAATNQPYRGINVISLWCEAQLQGFTSNLWGGFGYWKKQGGVVRKGSKSAIVVHYSIKEKEDKKTGEIEIYAVGRTHRVFNLDQIDGLPIEETETNEVPDTTYGNTMISVAQSNNITLGLEGLKACYYPAPDVVEMPERSRFIERDNISADTAYASTLGHELVHATGHENRLDRDLNGFSSSDKADYAREELVAELGAAFLCAQLGFNYSGVDNHAGYISSWLKVLKDDHSAIFTAAGQASKAVDFLLKGSDTDTHS